ncbi:hypothetical protein GCM10023185_12720 [Hymenobacter saemangeumensis]|uniref:Lipid/polyisoprenoid-binding YceI-like domain-containing protein n=1 Tax=Hymenobacter saemangeumensis TaxID=1084522 RepID=A0ABP8I7F5_9BACT
MKTFFPLVLCLLLAAPLAEAQTAAALPVAAAASPAPAPASARRYLTNSGQVTFFSSAPLEDIEALNREVSAVFELNSGKLAFSIPMRSFQFINPLMQEHFNENYAESDKYPRSRFSGTLLRVPTEEELRQGPQNVEVQGELNIHGVTRKVKVPGIMYLRGNELVVTSKFAVETADYKIRIPALVRDNIAKTIDVSIVLACPPAPAATASR